MTELVPILDDRYKGAAYLGAVSCRFMIPDSLNSGVASQMTTRWDFARDDIIGGYFVYPNFYVSSLGVDTAPGATRSITGSLEVNGVLNQILFSGSPIGVAADGQARLISDFMTIIIARNTLMKIHTRQSSTAGIIYSPTTGSYSPLGDQQTIGSNVADNTMVQGWTGTAGSNPYGPLFVAVTRRGSVVIIGDSRAQGVNLTSNSVPYAGELAPSLSPFMGVINLARGSVTAQQSANSSNFAKRLEYLQYASHAILQLGTNDIQSFARTAAQVSADRQTIRGYAPAMKWFETTLMPKPASSSDSWATLTGQFIDANNAVRVTFNDNVRAGSAGFEGHLEMADGPESARNSGFLKAPPMVPAAITADGNHCNNAGYALHRPFVSSAWIVR